MERLLKNVHDRILASSGSRCVVYRTLNPTFGLHAMYKDRHTIDDRHRMSFTRFRVSGHSLNVETGRWNRRGRGRLPMEERLCVCGQVQTEQHVVEQCPITSEVRVRYGLYCIKDLFNRKYSDEISVKITHDILNLFQKCLLWCDIL